MARGGGSFSVDIIGMRELLKLTDGQDLYATPWKSGMTRLASMGGLAAQRAAPVQTGKLQGSIRAAVQNRPFPQWAVIRVRARKRYFPYPRVLEYSGKHHHQHWLLQAAQTVWRGADTILNEIGEGIARRWAAG